MEHPSRETNIERSFELERIVFFSDAVFAIAITLLALELRVPDLENETSAALLDAVIALWPKFFAFALSFWIIAVYWLAHHRYFRYIIRYDGGLIGRNLLILFWVVLMPFTTLMMGEYGNLQAAIWFYAGNMIALGLSGAWLWRHATRDHRLVAADLDPQLIRQLQARALATPLAALIVFLLTFVMGGFATLGFVLIFVFQRVAMRLYPTNQK